MAPPHPDLIDALQLRRWALAVLTGSRLPAPEVPPSAWRLFLAREACAAPLRSRLGAAAPPPVRLATEGDLRQILLLRAELDAVLQLADAIGVAPVVLKGGAVLHRPSEAMWAKDIDLLLAPGDAHRLVDALDAAGWKPETAGTGRHFGERVRPGSPPVEVHAADTEQLQLLARAGPHPALPAARLLRPEDQIRWVLVHQVAEHPSHRGRLRDLALLALALDGSPALPALDAWHLPSHQRAPARGVLEMAAGISDRHPVRDHFPLEAAIWYEMDRASGRRRPTRLQRASATWVFALAAGTGAARDLWERSWEHRLENAGWGGRYGGQVRAAARAIWILPVIGWSWVAAQFRRRSAARALVRLDQRGERG